MYREMYRKGKVDIYCNIWPCDRECGKFHKPFLNATRMQNSNTVSVNTDQVSEVPERKQARSIFEEIMEAAARKDSIEFVQPVLPELPESARNVTLGSTRAKPHIKKYADTTATHIGDPLTEEARFRQELLADSDEERYSAALGHAPYIDEDEDTMDELLRITIHEKTSNPVDHLKIDETILTSDDEDDMLNNAGPSTSGSTVNQAKLSPPHAEYEKSILDL